MKTYDAEETMYLQNILENASDQTLFELFGPNWETVKAIIKKQAEKRPL